MSMVMFATLCDYEDCQRRSPEYERWPECRECMEDICPLHQAPESLKQDDEGRESCLCQGCADEMAVCA